MAINVILNSEYNIYANIFDNNVAKISYPTRNFYYNANCGNMFAECTTLQFNLSYLQGRFDYTTNMARMFYNCTQITGQPIVGPNTKYLFMTYYKCQNLTGSPVCGENVTNLSSTYYNCTNLIGSPVCGENVTNLSSTYQNCINLTGSPVCGENVTNLSSTYQNCINLTGSPVCGDRVVNMRKAYQGCTNLTGNPVCGNNVASMAQAYYNCSNLYGTPTNCEKVSNLYATFYKIPNLYGDFYINYNGTSAVNGVALFRDRNKQNTITIHVKPNSLWNNWFHDVATINNTSAAFTWIDMPGRYVNTEFNTIVQYDENSYTDIYLKNFNMYQIWGYSNYRNFKLNFYNDFYLTSSNYIFINIGNSVEYMQIDKNNGNCYLTGKLNKINVFFNANMYQTFYNCQNIISLPVGLTNQLRFDYVTDAYCALYSCYNLNMNISNCNFENVINLNQTFRECYHITGNPFSSNKTTDMYYAYMNCRNLTGIGKCGDNVRNFVFAYCGCSNINGAEFGANTTDIQYSYFYCNNLKSITCNRNAQSLYNIAFGNSTLLNKVQTLDFSNCTNMYRAFYNVASLNNTVNIYIGDSVKNFDYAFYNCPEFKGILSGGAGLTSMIETFYNCRQLKGPPICSDNVTIMLNAYRWCHQMKGSPVCGNNVTQFWSAYQSCRNITGEPVFGPKVINAAGAYQGCRNLSGNAIIPATVTDLNVALDYCNNVSNIVILKTTSLSYSSMNGFLARYTYNVNRNIIVINRTLFNTIRQYGTYITDCTFSAEEASSLVIEVAGVNYTTVRKAYNTAYNTYLYCTV